MSDPKNSPQTHSLKFRDCLSPDCFTHFLTIWVCMYADGFGLIGVRIIMIPGRLDLGLNFYFDILVILNFSFKRS